MATVAAKLRVVLLCLISLLAMAVVACGASAAPDPSLLAGYGGYFFDRQDDGVLYIRMENPSQEKSEAIALQVLGPERARQVREIKIIPGPPPQTQLDEWANKIIEDEPNWDPLIVRRFPGWPVLIMQGIQDGKIVYGIPCPEYISEARTAIQSRLTVLNIPWEVVDFQVQERVYPAIAGVNKLEECGPPHPAGFGGYYLGDDDSAVYVYLINPSREAAEEVALLQLGPVLRGENRTVHHLQGQYTFIQLEEWRWRFEQSFKGTENPGFALSEVPPGGPATPVSVSTNPRLNRLQFVINGEAESHNPYADPLDFFIGEADEAKVIQGIEERLAGLDIPLDAVVIEVESPQ